MFKSCDSVNVGHVTELFIDLGHERGFFFFWRDCWREKGCVDKLRGGFVEMEVCKVFNLSV